MVQESGVTRDGSWCPSPRIGYADGGTRGALVFVCKVRENVIQAPVVKLRRGARTATPHVEDVVSNRFAQILMAL